MINDENLNKLYNGFIEGAELTTKELNKFGFNSKDLTALIDQDVITRVKRGLYSLKSVDKLFFYGKELIAQKEYDKATQCFQKCYELDPTHKGVCFQLFLKSIQNKDYQKAFEYFDVFYISDNEFYNTDSAFYLFLLSTITKLPENHRNYAKFLKFDDFKIDARDKRYRFIARQNKMRLSASNQKFSLAIKQLNEILAQKGASTVQDLLIKKLLIQAAAVQKQNREYLINLIKQKKYEEIIKFYEDMESYHRLSTSDIYILILTKDLVNIISTKTIPPKEIFETNNIFDAITGKNFELALNLSNARNQEFKIDKDDNHISLLLEEIVNTCRELSTPIKQEPEIIPIVPKEEISLTTEQATFADVTKYLLNGDLDNSFKTLRNYLTSINKSAYEFLIVDLIKLSLLEKDFAFTKPMTTLTLISRDNYSFDASTYIQDFYINLSQSKLKEARIYLNIISESNKINKEQILTDSLESILNASEKSLNQTPNIPDELIREEPKEEMVVDDPITKTGPKPTPIKKEEISPETINSQKEFMDKKYEELLAKKGVILLKPMPSKKIDVILELSKGYRDMVAFVINGYSQQQVVLRYKPVNRAFIDIKYTMDIGNDAYRNGNYQECIDNYFLLLQVFKEPRSTIYSKIGLAYMKSYKISEAIDYLTIANALSIKEKDYLDLDDLIARLKGEKKSEESKPHFKRNQRNFNFNDVNDYYGIDNFAEINDYIINSKLDVKTACDQLGLSPEKIDIIYLIYAREYYKEGYYEQGDLFLKAVEKSENKTSASISILTEIRKNKKFYQNREDITHIELNLTLKPQKK